MKTLESYEDDLLKSLTDPDAAAEYLSACLEDSDPEVFLLGLRDVAKARGGIQALAKRSKLNRESLYRMLSKSGNPSLASIESILDSLGLRLSIETKQPA